MPNQQESHIARNARMQFIDALILRDYESITQEVFNVVTEQSMKYAKLQLGIFNTMDQEDIIQMAYRSLARTSQKNPEALTYAGPISLLINALHWASTDYLRKEGAYDRRGHKNLNGITFSLDQNYKNDNDDKLGLGEMITNENDLRPTETAVEKSELHSSCFDNDVASLDPREKMILKYYFEDDENMAQIGKTLGISESRVSQLTSRAINKLRNHFSDET